MTSPYQEPGQEREFLEQQLAAAYQAALQAQAAAHRDALQAQAAKLEAENRLWGFVEPPENFSHRQQLPEGVFRFAEVVKEPWCRCKYKTPPRLIKFLRRYKYPERIRALEVITRVGFDILWEPKAGIIR